MSACHVPHCPPLWGLRAPGAFPPTLILGPPATRVHSGPGEGCQGGPYHQGRSLRRGLAQKVFSLLCSVLIQALQPGLGSLSKGQQRGGVIPALSPRGL